MRTWKENVWAAFGVVVRVSVGAREGEEGDEGKEGDEGDEEEVGESGPWNGEGRFRNEMSREGRLVGPACSMIRDWIWDARNGIVR